MTKNKEIYATELTKQSVSILTKADEQNHRTIYLNTDKGRNDIELEQPQQIVDEVFAVWGDKPTEKDFVLPDLPEQNPLQPTEEQKQIAYLQSAVLDLMSIMTMGI